MTTPSSVLAQPGRGCGNRSPRALPRAGGELDRDRGAAVVWAARAARRRGAERFDAIGVDVVDTRPAAVSDWVVLDGYEFTVADHH